MKNHNLNVVLVKAGKNIAGKYPPGSPDSISGKRNQIYNLIMYTITLV